MQRQHKNYSIHLIADTRMPKGQPWALVETSEGLMLLVARSKFSPQIIAEAWAADRLLRRTRRETRQPERPVWMAV